MTGERKTLVQEHHWSDDPVLTFILDPATARAIIPPLSKSSMGPQHDGISHRRTQLAGFAALKKRCEELGWPELTADVALAWQREARDADR